MRPYEEFEIGVVFTLCVFILFVGITGYQANKRMEHNTKVYYGMINGVYE